MPSMSRLALVVALVWVSLTPPLAAAASAPPAAEARAFAEQARLAYAAGDLQTALDAYQKAYALKPAPRLLFNIAQCYRGLGQPENAIAHYRKFLDTNPDEPQAGAARELIAREQNKVDEAARAEKERETAARELEVQKARQSAALAESEAVQRNLELERLRIAQAPPAPPPVYTRWWFWGAIGVAAAGAAGIAIGISTAPRPTQTTWQDINAR